jgi:Homing endonuclease associated repeat
MGIATKTTNEAYCPHCFLLVEQNVRQDWPPEATRCPHCRLLIGPGRARPTAEANPGARGSAAGVFAHQAKREDGDDVSKDEVRDAIRRVAEALGSRPERLLMVDYQQRASADESLPTLSDVFSAFGSWKRARREAAL